MESRSTAGSGASGRSAEKGTRAGSAGIGTDASAEGEGSERVGSPRRARHARRARRGTRAEVGREGRAGVHVALAARHAVGGLPMAGWKCRFEDTVSHGFQSPLVHESAGTVATQLRQCEDVGGRQA